MFQYTGEYIKAKSDYVREFYTFTPAPLCKGISIAVDDELLALLTTAHKLLGVLEGLAAYLPDVDTIHKLMYLKECCYSLQIDCKNSLTFRDALKKMSSGQEDIEGITNLFAAYQYIRGKNVVHKELSKAYGLMLYGAKSEHSADVRNRAMPLGNVITNLKTYSPTAPEYIMPAYYDMIKFINMENHTDILIKTAMAHYQFEMIHPYESCNGLLGRVLILMMLQNAHYKAAEYMCLSEYLYFHKEAYFDKLSSTQSGGGYLPWIKFFVQAVCYAADRAVSEIKRFVEIVSEDERQITALAQSSKHVLSVYSYFKQCQISEIKPVSDKLDISYNTAAKIVKALTELNVLSLEQEQSRHKRYCHRAFESSE